MSRLHLIASHCALWLACGLGLTSCVLAEHQGIEVELLLRAEGGPSGWLHLESIALVPCTNDSEIRADIDDDRASFHPLGRTLGWLVEAISSPSKARADHGLLPGLVLDQAQLARWEGGSSFLGALSPSPGRYCEVHLTVTPAIQSSLGIREPDEAGWSMLLDPPAQTGTAIRSFSSGVWRIPLARAIHLDSEQPNAALTISLSPEWPSTPTEPSTQRGFEAYELIRRSASAEVVARP